MTEEDVLAFAFRLAKFASGIEFHFCRGGSPNRLWAWPERLHRALPDADKDYIRRHKEELKELIRDGRAPRLADMQASVPVCPYCRRGCVGQSHPAYDTLHNADPEVIARRAERATAVMLTDPDAAAALQRLVTQPERYRY